MWEEQKKVAVKIIAVNVERTVVVGLVVSVLKGFANVALNLMEFAAITAYAVQAVPV